MANYVRIAACQAPEFRQDCAHALAYISEQAASADKSGVDLLLFPEGYLQGYLTDSDLAWKNAIDLYSREFQSILEPLNLFRCAIVFGVIERQNERLYNSAVVVLGGKILEVYRKTHLLPGESIFEAGSEYPIFEIKGLKFGINICYDMHFPEAAMEAAGAGARVILCPANNMIRRENAEKWKHRHHEMRIERAKESGAWIISSDVTGERDGRIGYGPTSVINPLGEVVSQVSLRSRGTVAVDIEV